MRPNGLGFRDNTRIFDLTSPCDFFRLPTVSTQHSSNSHSTSSVPLTCEQYLGRTRARGSTNARQRLECHFPQTQNPLNIALQRKPKRRLIAQHKYSLRLLITSLLRCPDGMALRMSPLSRPYNNTNSSVTMGAISPVAVLSACGSARSDIPFILSGENRYI